MTSAGVIALSPFQPTILPQSLLRESANVSALSCRYDAKVTLIRHFNEYECLICGKPKNYGGMLMNTPPQVWGKRFDLEVKLYANRCADALFVTVVENLVFTVSLKLLIFRVCQVAEL